MKNLKDKLCADVYHQLFIQLDEKVWQLDYKQVNEHVYWNIYSQIDKQIDAWIDVQVLSNIQTTIDNEK